MLMIFLFIWLANCVLVYTIILIKALALIHINQYTSVYIENINKLIIIGLSIAYKCFHANGS